MKKIVSWVLSFLLSAAAAQAATVMPVFQNDTVLNILSFNDTFGHNVPIGTYSSATGLFSSQNLFRTFQSFGAVGDGVTDDTAAVQTAMNSGVPLLCNGNFNITSLVTVTNVDLYIQGGGAPGCSFLLNSTQSMFYATLTSGNRVSLKDMRINVAAAITAVTGPAQTAAFFITYPAGTSGLTYPSVTIENLQVLGTTTANYILNGVYLNDATQVNVRNLSYQGKASAFDINTHALVFDGTHTPTALTVHRLYANFAGNAVFAPQQTATGWQRIRLYDVDCVSCDIGIKLLGASDGLSDQAEIIGAGGSGQLKGITVKNASHVSMTNNYWFFAPMPISGGTNPASPICYEFIWTAAIPTNGATGDISHNTCDGSQAVGFTNRYGWNISGTSGTNMASHIGPNTLTNLEFSGSIQANTAGVLIEKQATKSVATELQNLGSAGANTLAPPLAVTDGSNNAAGLVGEIINSTVLVGSAVSLSTGVAKTVTSVSLTPGHWTCYGEVSFNTGGTTTITLIAGGINSATNTLPTIPPQSLFNLAATLTTGISDSIPLNTVTIDLASTTTEYLVAKSSFGTSTQAAYGFIECQRTQ